ncbi:MAG: SRPBCC family protein [Deltaproteobacteria bacterium]|nr:SRPBCC family protein [Deltaproteobacteria bacterium]MBW2017719.1 SRPBCC family protein [Deltaproteobacteria bacterium]MBW2130313.1 SRPBCC family protein [Deltaproteobacteria bacterium]
MCDVDYPCYTAGLEVGVTAEEAFDYLSDPEAIGRWALGCIDTKPVDDANGLFRGTSIFDGTKTYVRIKADKDRLLIDYYVGDAEKQIPRIFTRIIPGALCRRAPDSCIVAMTAWRPGDMSAERWRRLCATHDVEIYIIRDQLEKRNGFHETDNSSV